MVAKFRNVTRRGLLAVGVDCYHASEDRRVLEQIILPYLAAQPDLGRVLFVGCAWYTRGYRKIFKDRAYITLEMDPAAARYGARRHIVDTLENIGAHFPAGGLDAIVCNGVFGWGLNERTAVERAFGGCFECLRPGGVFVLGWNDAPAHRPFPPLESHSLRRFAPWTFPPLAASVWPTATYNRHTYGFYRKVASNGG